MSPSTALVILSYVDRHRPSVDERSECVEACVADDRPHVALRIGDGP